MALYQLAKDGDSLAAGSCPAIYSTDDPARMIGQGKKLDAAETAELLELGVDETAVAIPTETILRGVARYVSEQGDDMLSQRIGEFLMARGL